MTPTAPAQYFQGKKITVNRPAQQGDQGFDPARGLSMMLVTMPDGTQQVISASEITGESGVDRKTESGKQGAAQKLPQHESPATPVIREGDRTTAAQQRKRGGRKTARKSAPKRGAKKAKRATSRKKRL
jgi:hypothetical protein